MNSNFYQELANRNFYEKTASSQEKVKESLESFSSEQMEAIAAELNLYVEKQAAEDEKYTLESKVLDQSEKQSKEDKDDEKHDSKVEGGEGKTEETQTTDSKEGEESKTKEEKKEVVNDQAANVAGTKEGTNSAYVGDASAGNNVGQNITDEQKVAMVLQAYDLAAEKLASEGYSLDDYVYSKVGDEKMAYEIAENAEKLAYITGQNSLKVADDIIDDISNLLNS